MNLINEIMNSHAKSYLLLLILPFGAFLLNYLNIISLNDKNKKQMILLAFMGYLVFLTVHFRFISPYGE
ncbi:hypothetical protein [Methanobrevibacter sp.]|uniref:hypothetical protein n=1 Tax=Methanobrevibacter sp. TaxID=66852 RepID=UPI00388E4A73